MLSGQIQVIHENHVRPWKRMPGNQYHTNEPTKTQRNHLYRLMDQPLVRVGSEGEWSWRA